METVLAFGVVLTLPAIAWYLLRWIFSSADRKRGFRNRLLASLALLVLLFAALGNVTGGNEERLAGELGFENVTEYREAKRSNIATAEAWQDHKAALEAAKAAEEDNAAASAAAMEREASARLREATALREAEEEHRKAEEQAALVAKAEKREQCLQDARCSFEEVSIDLSAGCRIAVQDLAEWDFEWTDGWTEPAFSPAGWHDAENRILMAIGKSLKLQNGFGAWKRVNYLCAYDAALKKVVDAAVF